MYVLIRKCSNSSPRMQGTWENRHVCTVRGPLKKSSVSIQTAIGRPQLNTLLRRITPTVTVQRRAPTVSPFSLTRHKCHYKGSKINRLQKHRIGYTLLVEECQLYVITIQTTYLLCTMSHKQKISKKVTLNTSSGVRFLPCSRPRKLVSRILRGNVRLSASNTQSVSQ